MVEVNDEPIQFESSCTVRSGSVGYKWFKTRSDGPWNGVLRFPSPRNKPLTKPDQQANQYYQQAHNMDFLINFATSLFFNWTIYFSQPSTASVPFDEEKHTLGLQSVLEEHAWPDGVLCGHGSQVELLDDGSNNVIVHLGVNHNVLGLTAAVESGAGNGVRLQTAPPEPPPFPVHRMARVFRSRRLASRRQLPRAPRLVIH